MSAYLVLICNSDSPKQGSAGGCKHAGAEGLIAAIKAKLTEAGLSERVTVRESGCMNFCAQGVNMRIFPGNTLYQRVQVGDLDEIVSEHLQLGKPVTRLSPARVNRFMGF